VQTDTSPVEGVSAVTLSDSTIIGCRAIYVGTGGNLKVTVGGTAVTFKNIANGTLLPIRAQIIWATGTTAADVVALF